MAFLFPGFLFALFALSIPILVHLFNFRRYKTVFFTNVRFLKEVKKDTQSRNRLKHLLVLCSRLLALAALVFAFAQPFLAAESGATTSGQRTVSIYIDNSFSMDAIGKNGALLEDARNRAREVASTFSNSDKFHLLTNDFEGRHQRLVNKEEFLEMLDEVKLSPASRNIGNVIIRQKDVLSSPGTPNRVAYCLSDFQRSTGDPGTVEYDSLLRINLVPLESNSRNNVFIDSVWFPSPVRQLEKNDKVFVRIRNLSSNVLENQPVKLFINGQQRSPASFSIEPGSSGETFLSFVCRESGIQQCRVEITDHPLTFDDAFYFSFTLSRNIPVLSISETTADSSAQNLRAVFSDSLFAYREADARNIDYSSFPKYRLIVLNGLKQISTGLAGELKKFLEGGGSVFCIPGLQSDLITYRDFLQPLSCPYPERTDTAKIKVSKLFYEHPVFADVFDRKPENLDLPVITRRFIYSRNTRTVQEPLLQLQNSDFFISLCHTGNGKVYLSAVALDPGSSNFQRHALFVPVFFQAALHASPAEKLCYTIGGGEGISNIPLFSGAEKIFHIRGSKGLDLIPETHKNGNFATLFPGPLITEGGNYQLFCGDSLVKGISFNFDRRESDPSCFSPEELKELITRLGLKQVQVLNSGERSLADVIRITEQGTPLWKWFILACLLFTGIEVCLIRFMK